MSAQSIMTVEARKNLEDSLPTKQKEYEAQMSQYEIEKSKFAIQRFKGLGEMNPDELWSTTLNPETRNLLKVEYSKDINKDHKLIHTLMGNDVLSRKDFIIENAINVSNLDI